MKPDYLDRRPPGRRPSTVKSILALVALVACSAAIGGIALDRETFAVASEDLPRLMRCGEENLERNAVALAYERAAAHARELVARAQDGGAAAGDAKIAMSRLREILSK